MPAPDRLPQRLRHCVEQTVAAEALEGWRPTTEQVDALAGLISGDLEFDDYLSAYLSRYRLSPPQSRTWWRRRREVPYLVPGTSLLRNEFGADTKETLADLEFVATAGRLAGWHRRIADGHFDVDDIDVRKLHRRLFGDVYAWAGSYRITELRLGDDTFARRPRIRRLVRRVEAAAKASAASADDEVDWLAARLAGLYAEYNYVHPFREGNGRTGTLMLHLVTALRGRLLDLSMISRDEWYAASRASMPTGRNGRTDPSSLVPLLARALR